MIHRLLKTNDFFLERNGMGHLLGKEQSKQMGSIEQTTEEYMKMSSLSPSATAFFGGMAKWKKGMGQTDQETFAEIQRKVPGVEWEEVAVIPADLWALMLAQEPDLLQDEKRFEKWLRSDAAVGCRPPSGRKKSGAVYLGG